VNDSMEEAIQYAKKYLEDLLSFFGLNTDVYATRDDEVIQLNVPSTHLNGFLIGQRGENMRSLQYLTSTALKNNDYANNRVNVDIADYKKQRADRLRERAEAWVKEVRDSGQPKDLERPAGCAPTGCRVQPEQRVRRRRPRPPHRAETGRFIVC
jgi:predicted RNA-binding protein Jag